MAGVPLSPEKWSEFDAELETLIEGAKAAEESYTAGKGMSLASMAVGSAVMRLSKVRAMAQSRDLQGTKAALDKASVKIREAAFTSSGDPEGYGLGESVGILKALVSILEQKEDPPSERNARKNSDESSGTRAVGPPVVAKEIQRNDRVDDETAPPETPREETKKNRAKDGLFRDLCIVEPDDDPLSYLADEEDGAGGGRPKMRFLVAPVDPKLAEKENKMYWGSHLRRNVPHGHFRDVLPKTSLRGEGKQHVHALQEALLHQSASADKRRDRGMRPLTPSEAHTTAPATATSTYNGSTDEQPTRKQKEADATRDDQVGGVVVRPLDAPQVNKGEEAAAGNVLEVTQLLRKQVRQASKDDYWPRRSLAYTLEEQGEYLATSGNFSASCSAYIEASELFRMCSRILPADPEPLLRQWITAQRALEVGYTGKAPGIEVLERCIKLSITAGVKGAKHEGGGQHCTSSSCNNVVCLEAHLELAGALLLGGQFERCVEVCGHIIARHDEENVEALYSLGQALEALGRCEEARECEKRAASLDPPAD